MVRVIDYLNFKHILQVILQKIGLSIKLFTKNAIPLLHCKFYVGIKFAMQCKGEHRLWNKI